MAEPAYTRLPVDERRRQLIDAGSRLFGEHSFEEISMAQIARAAGVSKALLYHYFPSKTELYKAAVEEYATELARLIEPDGEGPPIEQFARGLERYLNWIENNSHTWTKLMQSAASLPEARDLAQSFRTTTLNSILTHLSGEHTPPPVLRNAVQGWLGYTDAAILDWATHNDLSRQQLADLLTSAFASALLAAQHTDPALNLKLG